jgi:hypothetical protein
MNKEYFYCYSPLLHKFLHQKCKIPYICTALHEHTKNKFWLYEKNELLHESIKKYNQIFN